MKVEFGEDKLIMSANTDAEKGSFALDISPLKFETCRERFACKFSRSTKGFYFKHPVGKSEDVAAFILKTEKVLKVRKCSGFSKTNKDSILWYEPAWFWKTCRCRRSLLTILLRAGMIYDASQDNYEEALFGYKYARVTKNAVMRFLYGYTKYVGPPLGGSTNLESKGWKTIFDGQEIETIKNYLVSPRERTKPKFDLKNELWV